MNLYWISESIYWRQRQRPVKILFLSLLLVGCQTELSPELYGWSGDPIDGSETTAPSAVTVDPRPPIDAGRPPTRVEDACIPAQHTNGIGQTWHDCEELNTFNQTQATRACEASGAPHCILSTQCGNLGSLICGYDVTKHNYFGGCWGFNGNVTGYVSSSSFESGAIACPAPGSGINIPWD